MKHWFPRVYCAARFEDQIDSHSRVPQRWLVERQAKLLILDLRRKREIYHSKCWRVWQNCIYFLIYSIDECFDVALCYIPVQLFASVNMTKELLSQCVTFTMDLVGVGHCSWVSGRHTGQLFAIKHTCFLSFAICKHLVDLNSHYPNVKRSKSNSSIATNWSESKVHDHGIAITAEIAMTCHGTHQFDRIRTIQHDVMCPVTETATTEEKVASYWLTDMFKNEFQVSFTGFNTMA